MWSAAGKDQATFVPPRGGRSAATWPSCALNGFARIPLPRSSIRSPRSPRRARKTLYLQILDLDDLDHLADIAAGVLPQV